LALVCISLADTAEWGYDDASTTLKGPSFWGEIDAKCNGNQQSPIDIPTSQVIQNYNYGTLKVSYSPDRNLDVSNNGHTGLISELGTDQNLDDDILSIPGLIKGNYQLAQFHFHWGQANTIGSEHTVNGKGYVAEMHLVHFNRLYPSLSAAVASGESDALAVVGVFFRVGSSTPAALLEILRVIPEVVEPGTETAIAGPINLETLLPGDKTYWTYKGSLTTPNCNQIVRWVLIQKAMTITQNDLDTLRATRIETSHTSSGISNTYRPTQPLNTRFVFQGGNEDSFSASGASQLLVSAFAAAMVAVAAIAAL